jgi:hypothetical protein
MQTPLRAEHLLIDFTQTEQTRTSRSNSDLPFIQQDDRSLASRSQHGVIRPYVRHAVLSLAKKEARQA